MRKSTAEKSRCIDGVLKERKAKAAMAKMNGERRKMPEMRRWSLGGRTSVCIHLLFDLSVTSAQCMSDE